MNRTASGFPLPLGEGMLFPDEQVVAGGSAWELVKVKGYPYGHYLRLLAGDDNHVVIVEMYLINDSEETNIRTKIAEHIERSAKTPLEVAL